MKHPTDSRKALRAASILTSVGTWFVVNILAFVALIAAHFALDLKAISWWPDTFAIVTNLLAGGLVSFLFYYLVVYLPEARKKAIIKAHLQKIYKSIKKDMLWAIVHASIKGGRHDIIPDFEFVESLTLLISTEI